jgi:hypothetical protein
VSRTVGDHQVIPANANPLTGGYDTAMSRTAYSSSA